MFRYRLLLRILRLEESRLGGDSVGGEEQGLGKDGGQH